MDHSEALEMKAAERYLLGDLSVSEVEEFERHFFDCPQCSEELSLLNVLRENARAVFSEASPGPRIVEAAKVQWWRAWIEPWVAAPALAAILIATVAGFETGVHRQSSGPEAVAGYPLYAAARGSENVITPPRGARHYTLFMDRTWDGAYESYEASIRDDPGGAERYLMPVTAPEPGRAIYVVAPIGALKNGRYTVVISGIDKQGGHTELSRYPFTLKFE